MKKVFWFDVETTGLNPVDNAIIQLAYIVEIDGEVKEEGNILIQPKYEDRIDDGALRVNGRSRDEIFKEPFIQAHHAYAQILKVFEKYVDRLDTSDKFVFAGYNVSFDTGFLSEFFKKNNDKYFGSWLHGRKLDPLYMLSVMDFKDEISLPNYKLQTVCDHFGIEIKAHDALSDIRATRELFNKII